MWKSVRTFSSAPSVYPAHRELVVVRHLLNRPVNAAGICRHWVSLGRKLIVSRRCYVGVYRRISNRTWPAHTRASRLLQNPASGASGNYLSPPVQTSIAAKTAAGTDAAPL